MKESKLLNTFYIMRLLNKSLNKNNVKDIVNGNLITYSLNTVRMVLDQDLTDKELIDVLFYCPFRFPDPEKEILQKSLSSGDASAKDEAIANQNLNNFNKRAKYKFSFRPEDWDNEDSPEENIKGKTMIELIFV